MHLKPMSSLPSKQWRCEKNDEQASIIINYHHEYLSYRVQKSHIYLDFWGFSTVAAPSVIAIFWMVLRSTSLGAVIVSTPS